MPRARVSEEIDRLRGRTYRPVLAFTGPYNRPQSVQLSLRDIRGAHEYTLLVRELDLRISWTPHNLAETEITAAIVSGPGGPGFTFQDPEFLHALIRQCPLVVEFSQRFESPAHPIFDVTFRGDIELRELRFGHPPAAPRTRFPDLRGTEVAMQVVDEVGPIDYEALARACNAAEDRGRETRRQFRRRMQETGERLARASRETLDREMRTAFGIDPVPRTDNLSENEYLEAWRDLNPGVRVQTCSCRRLDGECSEPECTRQPCAGSMGRCCEHQRQFLEEDEQRAADHKA